MNRRVEFYGFLAFAAVFGAMSHLAAGQWVRALCAVMMVAHLAMAMHAREARS